MPEKPELRLALAMRGGVSLAVWIGGAVAEIDLARRASPKVPDSSSSGQAFWKRLLQETSGYDAVAVDVMAGASAGGLNGVLYAASQVYGFEYDEMRAIWLTVGDTSRLARDRHRHHFPSLFKGDRFFTTQVRHALDDLTKHPPTESPRVSLELAATSLEPISRPVPSPADQPLWDHRHESGFRFRHPEEDWLSSSFQPNDPERKAAALWRLAVASRATSAFPAAFESTGIVSTRRTAFGAPATPPAPGLDVDFDGNFLDRVGTDGRAPSFAVSDGGILDNIPIRRALDAATRAPAGGPTERKLVYLQPGSTGSTTVDLTGGPRRSTVAVIKGAVAARMSGENINADIDALETYNQAVRRAHALRLGGFEQIGGRAELRRSARSQWGAYCAARASSDANRLAALLRDPIGVLGYDPFPQAVGTKGVADEDWRSPLHAWDRTERETLTTGLHFLIQTALHDLGHPAPEATLRAAHDPAALHRVTLLLLEWARYLECRDEPVGTTKESLYRVLLFIEEALLGATQQLWVAVAATAARRTTDSYVTTLSSRLPLLFRSTVPAGDLAEALTKGDPSVLRDELRATYERVGRAAAGRTVSGDTDILATLVEVLVGLAGELAATAPSPLTTDPALRAGQALDRALRGGGRIDGATLAALEVVCHPEFVAGLPGRRRIEFHRCSSENPTPLGPRFEKLRAGLPPSDPTDCIPVERKLAGNELGNFSAFLLEGWRANDWLWGRLDAVVTMVDLLVRPRALAARLGPAGNRRLAELEVLVRGDDTPWSRDVMAAIWTDETKAEIRKELRRLTDPAAEGIDDLPIRAIRTAFVARRQWDLLRDEWGHDTGGDVDLEPPTFETVRAWVAGYGTGLETLKNTKTKADRKGLRRRVGQITVATSKSVVWNLERGGAPVRSPWLVTGLLWTISRPAGWYLGRMLTKPDKAVSPGPTQPQPTASKGGIVGKVVLWAVPVVWIALMVLLRSNEAALLAITIVPAAVLLLACLCLRFVAAKAEERLVDVEDHPPEPPD